MDVFVAVSKDNSAIKPYNVLAQSGFPPSLLPSEQVLPLPREGHEKNPEGFPVCRVELNFISGGLLFAMQVNHAVCDGTGRLIILEQLAKNLTHFGDAVENLTGE